MPLEVLADAEAVAQRAAERVRAAAAVASEWRGRFRMAVPGGRTPARLFELLASDDAIAWQQTEIGFTDERAVPPNDPASNSRLLAEKLIAPLASRAPRVERMPAEWPDLQEAARACEAWFAEPLDLLILGVGEDGHVASLFPDSALLGERVRRVAAVLDSPKPPARRLTITPRVIAEARSVLVLATGGEKAPAVARSLEEEGGVAACPARLVRSADWLVDRLASLAMRSVPGRSVR